MRQIVAHIGRMVIFGGQRAENAYRALQITIGYFSGSFPAELKRNHKKKEAGFLASFFDYRNSLLKICRLTIACSYLAHYNPVNISGSVYVEKKIIR